ncbi:membrane protein [Streptomyces showdoensis]|uniref:Membrane protein n=1 Tax=Streptomyces showdoensis TaxID=68268 RepID=A0A2P2GFI0_STREW|nr:membrane protein [Streptomyces showdoensis]KKZ70251.1 membrane protein [Streptomyces showdoensis]
MPLISTLARMEAVEAGRARPLATVRHRHLSARPLVLVPLTTAGEAGAPLGALVGTDPAEPRLLVVPQPRDRDLRFAFLAELADAVLPYVDSFTEVVEAAERSETDPETGKKVKVEVELCADAPQLVVPGRAAVEYVRLLGRSTRFRRTAEQDPETPFPAPPRVPLLGRWLTHFGERARVPGSSLLVAATDLLNRHWATGQSSLEDQHLGSLLAWIDPPEGESGAEAALRAELGRDAQGQLLCPPAGPATDPAFDNRLLAPAIERYDRARQALGAAEDGEAAEAGLAELQRAEREIRRLLVTQLKPAWDATWRALGLLRELPVGDRVADRWTRDRWSFTGQRDRIAAGEPPQPRRDDAVTAAQKLAAREQAQAQLEAQEALDDPLVLAGRRLAGEAFAGEVVEVTMTRTEKGRPRPLLTVRTEDLPHLAEDVKVYRSLDGRPQTAEFVRREPDGALVLRVTDRMGRAKEPAEGSVPEKGERIAWTLFEHEARVGAKLPDPEETPWTHGGPPRADAVEPPDAVTPEDLL